MKSLVLAGLALTALAVAGCSTEREQSMNAPSPDRRPAPAPMAAAPAPMAGATQGTGSPVSRANMPTACRDEIAEKLGVGPRNVRVGPAAPTGDGTTVTASAKVGREPTKNYRCRFDTAGRFIEVLTLT